MKSLVNPFPLTTALVVRLLTEMTVGALVRVFTPYHLEVMEAMVKADPELRSKHLIRKLNRAINRALDKENKGGVR